MTDQTLYNQPGSTPTRKMEFVRAVGAGVSVLFMVAGIFMPEDMTAKIPGGLESALTTVLVYLAGYYAKERV